MTHENQTIIAELPSSKVIVKEEHLTIYNDTDESEQTITLNQIKQITLGGDTQYFFWFVLMLIPIGIFLYALGSTLPSFLIWALVVISGVLGLHTFLAPPERNFLVINMKQGDPVRVEMNDKKGCYLEFIRKTNVHIYKQNK